MEPWGTEFTVAVVVGALLIGVALSRLQGRGAAAAAQRWAGGDLGGLTRAVFHRTGYEHAALRGAPLDAQVARSMETLGQVETQTHLVRTHDGLEQHFEQRAHEAGGGGIRLQARWWTPARPAFGLHLADRRLSGLGQKAQDVLTRVARDFRPRYPSEVALADPDLAARFRLWTDDAVRAHAALADPALRAALLALPVVDLATLDTQISLSDPFMEIVAPKGRAVADQLAAIEEGHDAAARLLRAARARLAG